MNRAINNRKDLRRYRIVIKIRDDFQLPDVEAMAMSNCSLENGVLPKQLYRNFPSVQIEKLFSSLEFDKIARLVDTAGKRDEKYKPPDFSKYYVVSCSVDDYVDNVLNTLHGCRNIEYAYAEAGVVLPPFSPQPKGPLREEQGYLKPAPLGIDAEYAWQFEGGDGDGEINLIDIEQGWIADHESVNYNTYPDTGINRSLFGNHGSAVLGVIMMRGHQTGGIGITPRLQGHVVSQWRPSGIFNTADAIMTAISHLNWGDILLLQIQGFETTTFVNAMPAEIQRHIYELIRLATAIGISVIEPAGNGNLYSGLGNDLDELSVKRSKSLNPRLSSFRDSGAIMVAAATSSESHSRIACSNYGRRIDCFAWGENVVTAGNFTPGCTKTTNAYTQNFGGTSAASAIIAGAAVAIQGISESCLGSRLSPGHLRKLLRSDSLCTSSANGRKIDKIGAMPDLRKIIDALLDGRREQELTGRVGENRSKKV